jgi:hypothetical protein
MTCKFCQQDHNWSVEEALTRLARGPAEIRHALSGAGEEELRWAPPKAWSPFQVAVHLLDTELIYGVRFRKILSEPGGPLPAFDQDKWAEACSGGRDLRAVLDTFELLRKDNLALLRANTAHLHQSGQHPDYGELTALDILMHLSPHDEKHAGQIRRTREAYTKRGVGVGHG